MTWPRLRAIALVWSVEPRSSSTISFQVKVSYLTSYPLTARVTIAQYEQGKFRFRMLIDIYSELRITKQLANVYLPPVKTIDTFFLRQVMTGEKRVRAYDTQLYPIPLMNNETHSCIVFHPRSDQASLCSAVSGTRSGRLPHLLRTQSSYLLSTCPVRDHCSRCHATTCSM